MTQNRYDLVPYFSNPFQKTHPENLYTLARLFGIAAPDFNKARVLELGCAGGGNIIPMAYNLPQGRFVGVDLSRRQLEYGWNLVQQLKLTNIRLEHMSISDINGDFGQFDYIICHGVFSWVPPDVQDKILAVCNQNLSPTGIAYISYNCLPGWNFIKSIRDMMLYHVAGFDDPAEKAEQARNMLQFIINSQDRSDKAYTTYLKSEMEVLSRHQDSYLLHDHLEDINDPIYFHEFMTRAARHELDYLGDTSLFTMYAENLDEEVAATIQKIPELIRAEQYMDFIRNRRFRSTLLCHQGTAINRKLDVNAIEQFYLLTRAFPERDVVPADMEDGAPLSFTSGDATLTLRGRIPKAAMLILAENCYQPMAYDDLCRRVQQDTGVRHSHYIREQLNDELNLIRLLFAGMLRISATAGPYTTVVADKPEATRLVRLQASHGDVVANQRHEPTVLNTAEKILVRYLDGRHTTDRLTERLMAHISSGELKLELDGQELPATDDISGHVSLLCSSMLKTLAEHALLI
jgi:methyltransferase-like protein/SAM-dependent methyltransferase